MTSNMDNIIYMIMKMHNTIYMIMKNLVAHLCNLKLK